MPECLFVAAGGGGDAIAAAILASAMGYESDDALIATWAWDRLLIDPVPGPRRPEDFQGLATYAGMECEVLDSTRPPAGGGSTLPRLSAELGHRLLMIDPVGGAKGIAHQLAVLRDSLSGAQRVCVVDVGGDVLATGTEPGLRSPLADAVMLAASATLEADLLLAGPGLDGELTSTEVLQRLSDVGGVPMLTLGKHDVDTFLPILDWHPSEATALLVAAARGLRGVAEIREAGLPVPLTDQNPVVWAMPTGAAEAQSLAAQLTDTSSIDQAEFALRRVLGATELDVERRKAALIESPSKPFHCFEADHGHRLDALDRDARRRGIDFVTFRRIAEALGIHGSIENMRTDLVASRPGQLAPPLWSITKDQAK